MMKQQEILDNVQIGVSPLTGTVYIGLVDGKGAFKVKSDFTDRLKEFAPQLFEEDERGE